MSWIIHFKFPHPTQFGYSLLAILWLLDQLSEETHLIQLLPTSALSQSSALPILTMHFPEKLNHSILHKLTQQLKCPSATHWPLKQFSQAKHLIWPLPIPSLPWFLASPQLTMHHTTKHSHPFNRCSSHMGLQGSCGVAATSCAWNNYWLCTVIIALAHSPAWFSPVRATLHHITGIPFQGCYWEDGTEVSLFRGGSNCNINHYNIDTLQYESSGWDMTRHKHTYTWAQWLSSEIKLRYEAALG